MQSLTVAQIQAILAFLARAQCTGQEAFIMVEVVNALKQLAEQIPVEQNPTGE